MCELSIKTIIIHIEPNINSIIKVYSNESEQFTAWVLTKYRVSELKELSLWTNRRKKGKKEN